MSDLPDRTSYNQILSLTAIPKLSLAEMISVISYIAFFLLLSQYSAVAEPTRVLHPQTVRASSPIVTRTKDCPVGFELLGKECVATEILPFNFVCPPEATPLFEECAIFAQANRFCSEGLKREGNRCVAVETTPAIFTCARGELSGEHCIWEEAQPSFCPAGYSERSGECGKVEPYLKECPIGFTILGDQCIAQRDLPTIPECPPGFSLEGLVCKKVIPVPARCPHGYQMEEGECYKSSPLVPAECPDGFTPFANECRKSVELPGRLVCPEDYQLNGKEICEKEVFVPPTCPFGFNRGANGDCEKCSDRIPVCDAGETLIINHKSAICERKQTFPRFPSCPEGYELIKGKCKKVTVEQPVDKCFVGILEAGRCVTQSSSTPTLLCPPGYNLVKGSKCAREVEYDCSKTVKKIECEMPEFVSKLEGRKLTAANLKMKTVETDKGKTFTRTGSPGKEPSSKEPKCHEVPVTIPAVCTREEFAPPEYSCADGSEPVGKECFLKQESTPQQVCLNGLLDQDTGLCTKISIASPIFFCPEGTVENGKQCCSTEVHDAPTICPPGTSEDVEGRCVTTVPEVLHAPNVLKQHPSFTCDVGRKHGRVCLEVETLPRGKTCPSGTFPRGDCCACKAELILTPDQVFTEPPCLKCPDGKDALNGKCYELEKLPVALACPETCVEEDNICVEKASFIVQPPLLRSIPSTPLCPKGFTLEGRTCLATRSLPLLSACPPGFSETTGVDGCGENECYQLMPKLPICPPGTSKESDGCLKKLYAPPLVTEIKQYTKGQAMFRN